MSGGSWIRIGAIEANLDATTVNSLIKDVLGKRAISITQKPELRQAIGEEFVKVVTPFVPMRSGDLRESGRATDDGRVYWTSVHRGYNYADRVYDRDGELWPDGHYRKPTTPNTYPQWVNYAQPYSEAYSNFITNITPIIQEAFKDDE